MTDADVDGGAHIRTLLQSVFLPSDAAAIDKGFLASAIAAALPAAAAAML